MAGKKVENGSKKEIEPLKGFMVGKDEIISRRNSGEKGNGDKGDEEEERDRDDMDMNLYATAKTVAQGLFDIALLTANGSQLKLILYLGPNGHPFYMLMIILISVSIALQIIVGICFIFIANVNINEPNKRTQKQASNLNQFIIIGIFLITVVNVIISSFGIQPKYPFKIEEYCSSSGGVEQLSEKILEVCSGPRNFTT